MLTKYQVYMDDTLGGGFVSIGFTADATITTWTKSSLTTGGSYYFKVSAFNEISEGTLSASSSKIIAAVVPDQPAQPTKVSQLPSSIKISWTAPYDGGSPLTAYLVQWNGGSGSSFSTLATYTNFATLEFTQSSGITAGATYEFRIIAVNGVGNSSASTSVAIKAA